MADLTQIESLSSAGKGDDEPLLALSITRHQVRKGLAEITQRKIATSRALALPGKPGGILEVYDAACRALGEVVAIEDVLPLLDQIEHVKLHAKKVRDRQLLADAAAFQHKAERRLGQIIIAAKGNGHFTSGGRNSKSTADELLPPATLVEVGVDKKLSARAQKFAALDDRSFADANRTLRERVVAGAATVIDREAATEEKRQRRNEREQELGAKITALPQQKFGVIVADPPWRFEPWSRTTGMDRAADNHYPTACAEVIASLDVPSIAADDCVLFLWATAPMLPHALFVMAVWGFDYKSHFIWDKLYTGSGYWNRNRHELLLIGTRGTIPAPAPGTQEQSLITEARARHSAKPEQFLKMIEDYFPTLPKIELNRRGPARPGWAVWGNEATPHDEHQPASA